MGLLRVRQRAAEPTATAVIGSPPTMGGGLAQLARLMAADAQVWGGRLGRVEMMKIPAVRRGRNVIAGTIASFPLRLRDETTGDASPLGQLLRQPEDWRPRVTTLTWLIDDLLFYPYAWWEVLARDARGWPVQVQRVEPWRVTWQEHDGTGKPIKPIAFVDGHEVTDDRLIRFDGPDEGLITLGSDTLMVSRLLERSAGRYADVNIPSMLLRYIGAGVLNKDDAKEIRDDWDKARAESRTAVLSAQMEAKPVLTSPLDLQLVEARTYQALEVSRLLNLPPHYVGATSGKSDTYTNLTTERRDLVDLSLIPYISAVEQRLSMGDLSPRGKVVRFDLDSFLRGSPLERAQYITSLVTAEVITPQQGAEMEGLGGPETPTDMPGSTL